MTSAKGLGLPVAALARRARPVLARACLALLIALSPCTNALAADNAPGGDSSAQVLQAFEQQAPAPRDDATDRMRRKVMFAIGVPLLILILITGSLGIAVGVFGKQLYLLHMLCAGLTVTLAVVHAIIGIVWFFPF